MRIVDLFLALISSLNVKREKELLRARTANIIKRDHIANKTADMLLRDDFEVQIETETPIEVVEDIGVKIRTKVMVSNTITKFIGKIKNINNKGEDEDDNNISI